MLSLVVNDQSVIEESLPIGPFGCVQQYHRSCGNIGVGQTIKRDSIPAGRSMELPVGISSLGQVWKSIKETIKQIFMCSN